MSVPILNASGCLDALAAPDVARVARRVRDEDDHAAPARGEPADPDRGDRPRDAQLDRPPGARDRRVRRRAPAAARRDRAPALGLGRRLLGGGLHPVLRAARRRRARRRDRAQPLVPERRGGAGDGRAARRRRARGHEHAALREALACAVGHRRGGPRGRRRRRGRPLAREHDPRPRARSGHAAPDPRARRRRLLGPRAPPDRARLRPCLRLRRRRAHRRHGRSLDRARRARARRGRRRAPSRSARRSSRTPARPVASAPSSQRRPRLAGFETPRESPEALSRAEKSL